MKSKTAIALSTTAASIASCPAARQSTLRPRPPGTMRSSTSLSVGVAFLAASVSGFVQGPPRCVMTSRSSSSRDARGTRPRATRPVLQRPGSMSPVIMFAEDEPSGVASAAPAGEGEGSAVSEGVAEALEGDLAVMGDDVEPTPMSEAEKAQVERLEEIERLRAKEKFITQKTGDYECLQCSFVYKPDEGGQGALAGTQFEDLPSSWLCPVCKAPKDTFVAQTKTIAGFEDNLSYGLGANNLTGGQKNLLIFGSLAAFFVLFLAGYALE